MVWNLVKSQFKHNQGVHVDIDYWKKIRLVHTIVRELDYVTQN
jgi:hypothetical protein